MYSCLNETKISFFFLLQNQRTGGQNGSYTEVGTSGTEEDIGKGCRRVTMV
jgi:hypothetical protein